MEDIAGWVAPIATMLAAMITAANLGSRVTGWGFVVFLVGSIAWVTVAALTHQPNLMWSNLFLTVVNVVGIWRWLGRQARLDDGARAASERSAASATPDLFPAAMLADHPLEGRGGKVIGRVAGAMAECATGRISYLLVGEGGAGGVGERLHPVEWRRIDACHDRLRCDLSAGDLAALPEVTADQWPERAPAGG